MKNDGSAAKGIAIIPARGGSKRIPRKNIRQFCGKPIIQRVIEAATQSGLFYQIVVSTDDKEISEIAVSAGAETPFIRDAKLADDYTGTTDVIRDAINRLSITADVPVCCLYATAVFATAENLRHGYLSLTEKHANWAFSVCQFPAPIQRAYRRDGDIIVPFQPENMIRRSQDLEPAFFDAGQFYWALAKTWSSSDSYPWDGAAPIAIDPSRVVDIDTLEDWQHAELLYQTLNSAIHS